MYKWIFSQVYLWENIIGAQWKKSEMIDFRKLVHYFLCSWKLYWVVLLAPVVLSELFIRKCLTLTQQQRSCVLDSKEFPSSKTRHWGSGFFHRVIQTRQQQISDWPRAVDGHVCFILSFFLSYDGVCLLPSHSVTFTGNSLTLTLLLPVLMILY